MASLAAFIPEEQYILSGVFYKIGIWMSHIDDAGENEGSEEKEHLKLIEILKYISRQYK